MMRYGRVERRVYSAGRVVIVPGFVSCRLLNPPDAAQLPDDPGTFQYFTRRMDHDLSGTSNQRRPSNPLVHKHKTCGRGVSKTKAQPLRYSACSAPDAVGSKHGKGGPGDTHHDPDQYTEKKSFLERSRSGRRVVFSSGTQPER